MESIDKMYEVLAWVLETSGRVHSCPITELEIYFIPRLIINIPYLTDSWNTQLPNIQRQRRRFDKTERHTTPRSHNKSCLQMYDMR